MCIMNNPTMSNSRSTKQQEADQEPKPKAPLSAYNLFFQLERKRIINETDHLNLPVTQDELRKVIREHKAKGKRPHRKSHGKIGFRELARTVAGRWKKITPQVKAILEREAQIEKEQHIKDLKAWKARQDLRTAQQPEMPQQQPAATADQGFVNINGFLKQQGSSGRNQQDNLHALQQIRDEIQAEMNRLASSGNMNNLQQAFQQQPQQQSFFVPPPQVNQLQAHLAQQTPSMQFQQQQQPMMMMMPPQQQQNMAGLASEGYAEEPDQAFSRNFFDTDLENKNMSFSSNNLVDLVGLDTTNGSADVNLSSEEFDQIFS